MLIKILLFKLLLFNLSCQTHLWKKISDPSYRFQSQFLTKKHKVALILSPGMAKSFIHLGALKAIKDSSLEVKAVVGLGDSAFLAAFLASGKNLNSLSWSFYKIFRSKNFFQSYSYLKKPLYSFSFLRKNLPKSFNDLNLFFTCPSYHLYQRKIIWEKTGDLVSSVARCLSLPPHSLSQSSLSASFSLKEAFELLREKGFKKIIFINVLGNPLFTKSFKKKDFALFSYWSFLDYQLKEQERELKKDRYFYSLSIQTYFSILNFNKYRFFIEEGEAQTKDKLDQLIKSF